MEMLYNIGVNGGSRWLIMAGDWPIWVRQFVGSRRLWCGQRQRINMEAEINRVTWVNVGGKLDKGGRMEAIPMVGGGYQGGMKVVIVAGKLRIGRGLWRILG